MTPFPEKNSGVLAELRVVTAFCSLLVLAMAGIYALLRTGFGVNTSSLARAAGIALLLVNFPVLWGRAFAADNGERRWFTSPPAGAVFTVLLTGLLGTLTFANESGYLLATLGFAAAVSNFFTFLRERRAKFGLAFLLVLVAGSLWSSGVSWGAGFENPLYLENLALHGKSGSIDQFFHSALANMMTLHGVPSTGLDGVVSISYHYGSHWIFGRWAALIGLPVIDFYQLGYPLIVPAAWFSALAMLVLQIRRFRAQNENDLSFRGVVLIIVAAAVIGALPRPITYAGGFGIGPFFSESYAATLLTGFYLGGIVFAHLADLRHRADDKRRKADYAIALAVIPLGIVALGFLKVSTFAFTLVALTYAVFRMRLFRRADWVGCAFLTAALVYFSLPYLLQPGYFEGSAVPRFMLFGYLRAMLPQAWWPFFFSLHLFWSWVYVVLRLREEGVTGMATLRQALGRRSMLDAEIIAIASVICLMPGLLLPMPLDANYFSDQMRWASLALILGDMVVLGRFSQRLSALRERGIVGISPSHIAAFFIGMPLLLSFIITLLSWPLSMLRMNLATRKEISVLSGAPELSNRERLRSGTLFELADGRMISRGLANAPAGPVISALRTIQSLSPEEKRHTAVYIPKNQHAFWRIFRSEENCKWTGFVAPALTEVAMLDGLPPEWCGLGPNYGFGMLDYVRRGVSQKVVMQTDAGLCVRASHWGFRKVLVLEPLPGEPAGAEWPRAFRFRPVACGGVKQG